MAVCKYSTHKTPITNINMKSINCWSPWKEILGHGQHLFDPPTGWMKPLGHTIFESDNEQTDAQEQYLVITWDKLKSNYPYIKKTKY